MVLGTAAVWNPAILSGIGAPDRVVAAVDVADGEALGAGWSGKGRTLPAALQGLQANGIQRLLITSIARDGTMDGPDLALIGAVSELVPGMRLIASGGVGELSDLQTLADAGCEAAIVGRALYEERFTIEQAQGIN